MKVAVKLLITICLAFFVISVFSQNDTPFDEYPKFIGMSKYDLEFLNSNYAIVRDSKTETVYSLALGVNFVLGFNESNRVKDVLIQYLGGYSSYSLMKSNINKSRWQYYSTYPDGDKSYIHPNYSYLIGVLTFDNDTAIFYIYIPD